jgi:hypothetical protein
MIWRRWLMVLLVFAGLPQGWSSTLEAHQDRLCLKSASFVREELEGPNPVWSA